MSKRAEQEREEFEAWASGPEFGLTQDHFHKFDNGVYDNYPTQCYWEVWQASREAMKADPLTKAAPDLLEALEEAVKDLVAAQVNARQASKWDQAWSGVSEMIQPSVDLARAAIAKATGADHEQAV